MRTVFAFLVDTVMAVQPKLRLLQSESLQSEPWTLNNFSLLLDLTHTRVSNLYTANKRAA